MRRSVRVSRRGPNRRSVTPRPCRPMEGSSMVADSGTGCRRCQDVGRRWRKAVMYSIVAGDDATGDLGVAVQTAMFAVGSIVPWVRAGVGAVATQAIGEPAYGPRCLDALAGGATASEAVAAALADDPMTELRQVGGAWPTAAQGFAPASWCHERRD